MPVREGPSGPDVKWKEAVQKSVALGLHSIYNMNPPLYPPTMLYPKFDKGLIDHRIFADLSRVLEMELDCEHAAAFRTADPKKRVSTKEGILTGVELGCLLLLTTLIPTLGD